MEKTNTKKLKIGIFGIGHNHAAPAIAALKKCDRAEIVGLWEENDEMYEKRLKENPAVYGDLPRMSKRELFESGISAAMVEESVPRLVPTAAECAKRGLHVHMDKPAGTNLEEYEQFLSIVKAKNLVFQSGYMYRYNAGVKYLLQKVRSGALGRIYNISAQMSTKHPADQKKQFISYGTKAPVAFIFGCHLIDLCMQVKGAPQSLTAFHSVSGDGGIDFEDTSLIVMTYADGIATAKVSSVEANGWGMRELTVFGEKGSVSIRPLENPMAVYETLNPDEKPWNDVRERVELKEEGRYDAMAREFVAASLGEIPNPTNTEYEYLLQKLTLRACGYNV